jgi:hypothetical protein
MGWQNGILSRSQFQARGDATSQRQDLGTSALPSMGTVSLKWRFRFELNGMEVGGFSPYPAKRALIYGPGSTRV